MRINLKARLKNKTFVITMSTLIVAFVYQFLSMFNIVPRVTEDSITGIITMAVNALAALGVLVDPTTDGVNDSERAMTYYTDNDAREETWYE